ncbi:unnamed protein product, partial [Polarella glacialis]
NSALAAACSDGDDCAAGATKRHFTGWGLILIAGDTSSAGEVHDSIHRPVCNAGTASAAMKLPGGSHVLLAGVDVVVVVVVVLVVVVVVVVVFVVVVVVIVFWQPCTTSSG